MQFASFTFLCLFFPITLGIYYLTPQRWRQEVLLAVSVLFLLGGGWMAALMELLLTAGTFGTGLLLERLRQRKKLADLLVFAVAALYLGALVFLRSDMVQSWNRGAFHGADLFPLGMSFFVLQAIGYCIDVSRGKISAERSWRNLSLYLLFFPRLIMGPVVSYSAAKRSLCEPGFSMERIGGGMLRFLTGLAKKLVLADWVGMLFQTIQQVDASAYSLLLVWLGAFAKLLSLYLEFSGYADMAIGLGTCYGVRLPESYGTSLFVVSITRFADQWNRTVVQWFSHYVGTRFHGKNQFFHLLAVTFTWGCVGLWYQFHLPALIFGVGVGVCIWLEHMIGIGERYTGIRRAFTMLLLSVGVLFLVFPSLSDVMAYLRAMFGSGHLTLTESDATLLRCYGLALLLAVAAATGCWKKLVRWLEERSWFRVIQIPLTILAAVILLAVDLAVLVSTNGAVSMQLLL